MNSNQISIECIGDGGAFDINKTKSSFVVWHNNEGILFDCGYDVFPELVKKEYIDKLNYVFISHMDDDHMGSIKSFIYYRWYILNKKTEIYGPDELYEYLHALHDFIEFYTLTFESAYENILDEEELNTNEPCVGFSFRLGGKNIVILTFPALHHIEAYSFIVVDDYFGVLISGDTLANPKLEKFQKDIQRQYGIHDKAFLIFHDYSEWDNPNNVHAHDSDINETYSEQLKQRLIKYHNSGANIAGKLWIPKMPAGGKINFFFEEREVEPCT